MTPLNTIIEDEVENLFDTEYMTGKQPNLTKEYVTTAMQRAYEAGRISWLRSEIEKLEPLEEPLPATSMTAREALAHNKLLSSIITRYKEELLELEKEV